MRDKYSKYINYVADDYLKEAKVIHITVPFGSSGELRDMGWDDEMLDFAYTQFERFGFREQPDDEDSYYYVDNPDHEWSFDEMLMDMFYIFIDEKVKTGEFIETYDGWEINQNMWDIDTGDGFTHIFDWNCKEKDYGINIKWNKFEDKLIFKYGVPENILTEVTDEIVARMIRILDNEKKFC
jgi:hypothetical protein